jgi:protocatechuate 3,4-dioxygenase beta subunit
LFICYYVFSLITRTFLRGVVLTNDDGVATFTTIYPGTSYERERERVNRERRKTWECRSIYLFILSGWYEGRTVHIHVKVHVGGYVAANDSFIGGSVSHTGQLFFTDSDTDATTFYSPYSTNTNKRITNEEDDIFTVCFYLPSSVCVCAFLFVFVLVVCIFGLCLYFLCMYFFVVSFS